MKNLRLFTAVALLFTSCETLVDDIPKARLPRAIPKLAVHCFLSPQNPSIHVVVSESVPIFSESDAQEGAIKDALVKLSDGKNEVIIPFDEGMQLYRIDQSKFKIIASRAYTLTVSHGDRTVTAHCRVPEDTPVIKSYELDTVVGTNPAFGFDTTLTAKLHWEDMPKDTNFYRVAAAADIEYSILDTKGMEKRITGEFNFFWSAGGGSGEWQSDQGIDGSAFSSPPGKSTMPGPAVRDPASKPLPARWRLRSVTMLLYNTDVHYFKYHRSVQQRMDTDNPFTEPSAIYGNIEGGLGCFGAYNVGKLVYKPD